MVIQRVGVSDAAKHPTRHRTAPTTKNFLAPNVSSVEVEIPADRSQVAPENRSLR